MFLNLIKLLLTSINSNVSQAARDLGYKTQPSFYGVISGKDIKLTILLNICKLCNCDIIITNHQSININLAEYMQQQGGQNQPGQDHQ